MERVFPGVGVGIMRRSDFDNGAGFGDAVDFIHRIENAVENLDRILANDDVKSVIRKRPGGAVEIVNGVYSGLLHPVDSNRAGRFITAAADIKNHGLRGGLTSRFGWSL